MRINLLDEKEIRRQIRWDQIFIVVLVIIIFFLPAGHYYLNYMELDRLKTQRDSLQAQSEALQPRVEEYFELQEQIREFEIPEELEVTRYRLGRPLRQFGVITPEAITLESLDYEDGELVVQGFSEDIDSILTLVEEIFNSDLLTLGSLQRFHRNDLIDFTIELTLETREELP